MSLGIEINPRVEEAQPNTSPNSQVNSLSLTAMSLTVSGSSAASIAGAPTEVSTVSGLSSVEESQQRYMDQYHADTLVEPERVPIDNDVERTLWKRSSNTLRALGD